MDFVKGKSYFLWHGKSHYAFCVYEFGDTPYTMCSISNVCTCSIQMYCTYVSCIYHMCRICIHVYIYIHGSFNHILFAISCGARLP